MPKTESPPSPSSLKDFAKSTFRAVTPGERILYRKRYAQQIEDMQTWLAAIDEIMIEKGEL